MQEETVTVIEISAKNYYKRVLKSVLLPGILLLFGYIIISWTNGSTGIFKILVPIYLLLVLFFVYANRLYLTRIAKDEEGRLFITYSDFNAVKTIKTNLSATSIYKGLLWKPNSRQPFLVLQFQGQRKSTILRQFTTGEWTNNRFDELLQAWPSTRHTANTSFVK